MDNKDVKNITINYENYGTEVIKKGLVIDFSESDNESVHVGYTMCNISGGDLYLIVNSVMALAQRLGMFNEEEW